MNVWEGMKSVQNPAQYVSSLGHVNVCARDTSIFPLLAVFSVVVKVLMTPAVTRRSE